MENESGKLDNAEKTPLKDLSTAINNELMCKIL